MRPRRWSVSGARVMALVLSIGVASWSGCGSARPRTAAVVADGRPDVIIVGAGVAGLTAAYESAVEASRLLVQSLAGEPVAAQPN